MAKRVKLSQESIDHATEIKLRAERKAGEILKATPKNEGGRPEEKTSSKSEPVIQAPTLAELGVTKKESSRFQKLASLPEDKFALLLSWQKEENLRFDSKIVNADAPTHGCELSTQPCLSRRQTQRSVTVRFIDGQPWHWQRGWLQASYWLGATRTLAFLMIYPANFADLYTFFILFLHFFITFLQPFSAHSSINFSAGLPLFSPKLPSLFTSFRSVGGGERSSADQPESSCVV